MTIHGIADTSKTVSFKAYRILKTIELIIDRIHKNKL